MQCPQCKSENTKRVTSRDPKWSLGAQRCQACGHQDHWMKFIPLRTEKPADAPFTALDVKKPNPFHEHLDGCSRCRNNPFDLCPTGAHWLEKAATE